jgi:uncharacterized repeat protein (TIGR01451 family)
VSAALVLLALGLPVGRAQTPGKQGDNALPAIPAAPGPLPLAADLPVPGSANPPGALSIPEARPSQPPAFRLLTPFQRPAPPPGTGASQPAVPQRTEIRADQRLAVTVEKRGPAAVQVGQPVACEIVVRNVGPVPAVQLNVEDELPAGTRLMGTAPVALVQGQHLTWKLTYLGPGQECRFRVEILAAGPGDLTSRATVTVPLASTAAMTRVVSHSLAVRLEGPEAAALGQRVDFKIHFLNEDSQPLRNVVLLIRLPDGLRHQERAREIETEPFDLGPGSRKDIDLHLQAAAAGRQVLEAVVTAQGQQARDQAIVQVAGSAPAAGRARPDLSVGKVGPQVPLQGEKYLYRLEVENRGPMAITNVTLHDRLPDGLELVSAADGGVYDAANRTVEWRLGTLRQRQRRAVLLWLRAVGVGEQVNPVWVQGDGGQEARLTARMEVESNGSGRPGQRKSR